MVSQQALAREDLRSQPISQAPLTKSWHIVQIKPGGLALAERNLARQGFEVLFPRTRRTQNGRRPTARMELLFSGYGFVAVTPGLSWLPINSTYGVARLLLGSDRTPAQVPPGFMEALQARCEKDILSVPPVLAPGDQVRIASGPFAELLARIERLEPLGRVTVLLDLLSQTVRLSLPAHGLSRADGPTA